MLTSVKTAKIVVLTLIGKPKKPELPIKKDTKEGRVHKKVKPLFWKVTEGTNKVSEENSQHGQDTSARTTVLTQKYILKCSKNRIMAVRFVE